MTDDIEREALALANKATDSLADDIENFSRSGLLKALYLAIKQHKAFRQDVSERIEACSRAWPGHWSYFSHELARFIIAKPDPVRDILTDAFPAVSTEKINKVCEAIAAARGLQITEIDNG